MLVIKHTLVVNKCFLKALTFFFNFVVHIVDVNCMIWSDIHAGVKLFKLPKETVNILL